MLSRAADSIYWLSRYIERAENVARFIDVNLHLMLDLPVRENEQWEPLVRTTGDQFMFEDMYGAFSQQNVMRFLTFDPRYPNSILSCLRLARENARSIRSGISSEMWEHVNRFYHTVNDAAQGDEAMKDPHRFFTQVKIASHLFLGITDSTMSHGEAWHFGRLGRLVERADKTSRILDVKYYILLPKVEYVGTPFDNIQWAAVLKSASALEMYRKNHHRIAPFQVVRFLIFDRKFPRAVRHCLQKAEESLHAISGSSLGSYANSAERRLGRLKSEIDFIEFDEIVRQGIHEFLDMFQWKLNEVGDAIAETFFAIGGTGRDSGGSQG